MNVLGLSEIAAALGISRNTVAQWNYRGKLPPPDWRLAMGPVWRESTINRWAEREQLR